MLSTVYFVYPRFDQRCDGRPNVFDVFFRQNTRKAEVVQHFRVIVSRQLHHRRVDAGEITVSIQDRHANGCGFQYGAEPFFALFKRVT